MQRSPTMKTTPPIKMHIAVNEERKTPARPPIAWGYRKMEKGWNFDGGETEEDALFEDV